MALVQLTKADAAAPPRPRRRVIGIDLGTTNSVVATVVDDQPVVLPVDGQQTMPSAVHYEDLDDRSQPTVGIAAKRKLGASGQLFTSIKRHMGRDDIDQLLGPLDPQRRGIYKRLPVEASARILGRLVASAQERLGGPIEGAVVTVPAYFDDAQRQATKDAARLIDLEVLRLINEPTAAALAYGLDKGSEGVYVVYDLGGGTFDVTVLKMSKGLFEVLATAGDTQLGGDDIDSALAQIALERLGEARLQQLGLDSDARRNEYLLGSARMAKEQLGGSEQAQILPLPEAEPVVVTVQDLQQAAGGLIDRTIAILISCIKAAGLGEQDIDGVIMVGGSTRMPLVARAVDGAVAAKMLQDLDPDEVVALGAAAQADILAGNRSAHDWLLLDVNPLSLGIETMGGLVERIIPRNSSIPVARGQEFTTHKDGQSAMSIHVVQGERDLVADCRSLAKFSLKGIPPMPAGTARVLVTYRLDTDGLLAVSAVEQTTGTEAAIDIKPSYGLDEGEMLAMLKDARLHAKDDIAARAQAEARAEAESVMGMLKTAMRKDAELVEPDGQALEQALAALEQALGRDDADAVRAATGALDRASEGFAERRMQKAMRSALAGKDIDEVA